MSTAIIGYENLFEGATVSASSEAAGFDKENAYDWLTHDWWKPTGTASETLAADLGAADDVDYLAIFAHDLGTQGARLQFQHDSTGAFSSPTDVVDISPTDDALIFKTFNSVNERYWRLLITGASAAVSVGVTAFGERLDIPGDGVQPGFVPPNFSFEDTVLNSRSASGAFIGRSIQRKGIKGSMRFDWMDPAWMRSDWLPFLQHARLLPFFWSWDQTNYPGEAAYCWTDRKITPPKYVQALYMDAPLNYVGLIE